MNFYHNDTSRAHKDRIIRLVSDYLAEVAREKLEFRMPQLPYQNSAIKVTGINLFKPSLKKPHFLKFDCQ